MEIVEAAGGVVYRLNAEGITEVLVIFRRGVWDLPKGKCEDGETIEACAVREVTEEIGTDTSPEITAHLLETYHEYEQEETWYGKTTHWYSMKFKNSRTFKFHPEIGEGIEQVKWISLSDAKKRVGYENLLAVLDCLEEKIR